MNQGGTQKAGAKKYSLAIQASFLNQAYFENKFIFLKFLVDATLAGAYGAYPSCPNQNISDSHPQDDFAVKIVALLFFRTHLLEHFPNGQRNQAADDTDQEARYEAFKGVLPNQPNNLAGHQHGGKRDEQPFHE